MKISIISFSGRANGNCSQIADYLNELHQGEATIYRFSDFSISACGNCNHECMAGNSCPHIDDMEVTLQEATANSDMTYFIVPNYCGYPCSNFFVFNERCVCWTWGRQDRVDAYNNAQKKAIIVSNSGADNFKKTSELPWNERGRYALPRKQNLRQPADGIGGSQSCDPCLYRKITTSSYDPI